MSRFEKPDPVNDARLVAKEVEEWERHLNEITGLMGFTFSLAALGTPVPQLWGCVSLVFVFLFHRTSSKNKLSKLHSLEAKEHKTEYDKWVIRDIRKTIKIANTPIFLLGYTLMIVVALAPDLFMQNVWLLQMLYGDSPHISINEAVGRTFSYFFNA